MKSALYVLAGIRGGYSSSGHTHLEGEDLLIDALKRVALADEIVFPSLSCAYHADLRLMGATPPNQASVVFVNLSLPGRDIPYELEYVKQHLPCAVFVLYASDKDFKRCSKQLPRERREKLSHYFLLHKPSGKATGVGDFDAKVRAILDQAKDTAVKRTALSTRFCTAFISYSHDDADFARWLYDNLHSYGIKCWHDEKQLRAGDKIHSQVEAAIGQRDKVLLCASRSSLNSWWVDNEINSVITKEQELWKQCGAEVLALIPLNLDGYLFSGDWKCGWKSQITSRLAPDFTHWQERIAIDAAPTFEERQAALDRLGRDLYQKTSNALESVRMALFEPYAGATTNANDA
jgi:TIR domain-containing protein